MHALFVHKNFPAQFGHVAARLVRDRGWRCTFLSARPAGTVEGVELVQYAPDGGTTAHTHRAARSFDAAVRHGAGVHAALRARPDLRPDVVVAHSGFGSPMFVREALGDVPLVGYFEYFYRAHGTDLDFREAEFPVPEADRLRARARNAAILLDLDACDAGYAPTAWQHAQLPAAYRDRVRVLHDGIDTAFWRRRAIPPGGRLGALELRPGEKLVTYVSRGLESLRGFDVFMRMAKRLCDERDDVRFVVVGGEDPHYGPDRRHTGGRSFRDWVLARDDYDLDRIHFTGQVAPRTLVHLLSVSDLHVYLTVPFVLSWSLLNAMACGCTVLASDTAPVREVVTDGETGLLSDFFDDAALAARASAVLDDPRAHRATLGAAAARLVRERYAADVAVPRIAALLEDVALREMRGDR